MPLSQREIRFHSCTIAMLILTALSFGCVAAAFLTHPRWDAGFLALAVIFIGLACTYRIKGYVCELNRQWQAAFELGRHVGREEANGAVLTRLR